MSGHPLLTHSSGRSVQRRWLRAGFLCLAMLACIGRVWSADPDLVTLNFVNADIEGVVKAVSEITGKNFVLDPRVKGTVNIVSTKPIPRALVYDVFLSALRVQGYAAIDEGGIVRIVPESDARLYPSPTLGPRQVPRTGGDRIETQVFTLKYESAAQLVPILRPLISPNNPITAYPASNSLVVTDYAGNLRRIEKIVAAIDQPSSSEPVVIPLHYASALDVAQTVGKLFSEASGAAAAADPSQRLTVVADARSNSLIVRSANPARLFQLRSLVATLDSPTSVAGNIHVVYLKNAQALEVAKTLRAIYTGKAQTGSEGSSQSLGSASGTSPSGLQPSSPTMTSPLATASTYQGQGQGGFGSNAASSEEATAPGIIQADPDTNALIINAPDAIYNNLRAVIDKLDVRRKEVYVKALIAEITSDKAAEFGIQWQNLNGVNSSTASPIGGTNFGTVGQNILGIAQNPASAGAGLNIGVVKGVVTIPGITGSVLNLGLLVRALESDSSANILSTPTLLTLDNQEANIVVGQNVPFITGQYALSGAATTPTPFQTIERQDIGLTLRIKPQITEGGSVRLQIYAEVSSIANQNNPAGIITNKRSVQSTVQVNNGQIIVIGGLIQDSVTNGVQKVPLLGDVPVVGSLFRYDTREHTKTNLMVFLQPTIVHGAHDANPITDERYDYILGAQRKDQAAPNPVLPNMTSPSLPPRTPGAPARLGRLGGAALPAPGAAARARAPDDRSAQAWW